MKPHALMQMTKARQWPMHKGEAAVDRLAKATSVPWKRRTLSPKASRLPTWARSTSELSSSTPSPAFEGPLSYKPHLLDSSFVRKDGFDGPISEVAPWA